MEAASRRALDFETAAIYDRIRALTHIAPSRQDVNVAGLGEADVVAMHLDGGQACIQIFFRAGQNFGNRAYFPRHTADAPAGEFLAAFLAQFYEGRPSARSRSCCRKRRKAATCWPRHWR
jgi:excinuclease ABC subunit C